MAGRRFAFTLASNGTEDTSIVWNAPDVKYAIVRTDNGTMRGYVETTVNKRVSAMQQVSGGVVPRSAWQLCSDPRHCIRDNLLSPSAVEFGTWVPNLSGANNSRVVKPRKPHKSAAADAAASEDPLRVARTKKNIRVTLLSKDSATQYITELVGALCISQLVSVIDHVVSVRHFLKLAEPVLLPKIALPRATRPTTAASRRPA